MMSLLVCALHAGIGNMALGLAVIALLRQGNDMGRVERCVFGVLAGLYAETLLLFVMTWAGLSFGCACGVMVAAEASALCYLLCAAGTRWRHMRFSWPVHVAWYEWLLLLSLSAKTCFVCWQMHATRLWAYDSLVSWAMKGKLIYYGVNWSMDPGSAHFLGKHMEGLMNYPLGIPLWRAMTAIMRGGWDDIIARGDGLLFYLIAVAIVWAAVRRMSGRRSLAALAAFIMSAVPLAVWHAAAGYADIAVTAFAAASISAYLKKDFMLSGLCMAACAWMKNDGLLICGAVYLLTLLFVLVFPGGGLCVTGDRRQMAASTVRVLGGLATIMPWLIFNGVHGLGFGSAGLDAQNGAQFAVQGKNIATFLSLAFFGESFNIFWLFSVFMLLACTRVFWRTEEGKVVYVFSLGLFCGLMVIYGMTNMSVYMNDHTGIFRSLLQIAGVTLIAVFYGVSPDSD